MGAHDGGNADQFFGSTKLASYKPLIYLIVFCVALVVVGFVFEAVGLGLWAGLFGAMAVVFFLSIIIATVLFWMLQFVGF